MSTGSEWYAEYLESPHWRRLRAIKLARSEHRCERCGELGVQFEDTWYNLQVHHLTYERCPDNEELSDLEVLCTACHQQEHLDDPISHAEMRAMTNHRIIERTMMWDRSEPDEIDAEVAAWDALELAYGDAA